MKKGLFDAAIADTNSLISIDEGNVGAYYIRGKLVFYPAVFFTLISFKAAHSRRKEIMSVVLKTLLLYLS